MNHTLGLFLATYLANLGPHVVRGLPLYKGVTPSFVKKKNKKRKQVECLESNIECKALSA